jgi:hypothetical protein
LISYYKQQLIERDQAAARVAMRFNVNFDEAKAVVSPGVFPGLALAELPSGLDYEASVTVNVSQLALPGG